MSIRCGQKHISAAIVCCCLVCLLVPKRGAAQLGLPRDELFPDEIFQGNTDFVSDSCVTDHGMEELRRRMPYADLGAVDQDRRVEYVPDLFTVDLIARYIQGKLENGSQN